MKKQTKIRATVTFNYKGKTVTKTAYREVSDVLYKTRMFMFPYTIPANDVIDVVIH